MFYDGPVFQEFQDRLRLRSAWLQEAVRYRSLSDEVKKKADRALNESPSLRSLASELREYSDWCYAKYQSFADIKIPDLGAEPDFAEVRRLVGFAL